MVTSLCVAYDLTRLFIAPVQLTPRGIDRIELGFAKHFLRDWQGRSVATLPTPAGVRVVSREAALRVIERAEMLWGEIGDADSDPLVATLRERLKVPDGRRIARKARVPRGLAAAAQMLRQAGCAFGPLAAEAVPQNAVYLNVGQVGFALPQFLGWLNRRRDVKPVFMLHDLIPLEFPGFVPASSNYFHRQMVDNVAAFGAAIIANSNTTRAAIVRDMHLRGRGDMPILTEPLPIASAFAEGPALDAELARVPYFVVVGSIEPRKNHRLLLNVWAALARIAQPNVPRLVIAGARWKGHQQVTNIIARSERLRRYVVEVGGLSTPSLRRLLSNAKALLMPSFAEGFGLPIIEARALGVPVITSDIPAHREAGGDEATYIDPSDPVGWLTAIQARLREQPKAVTPQLKGLTTWPQYLKRVEPFIAAIGATEDVGEGVGSLEPAAATAA